MLHQSNRAFEHAFAVFTSVCTWPRLELIWSTWSKFERVCHRSAYLVGRVGIVVDLETGGQLRLGGIEVLLDLAEAGQKSFEQRDRAS